MPATKVMVVYSDPTTGELSSAPPAWVVARLAAALAGRAPEQAGRPKADGGQHVNGGYARTE